jgi:hypothetical protein
VTCDPDRWVGLGFVATAANAAPDVIAGWGCIYTVAPQICFGLGYPENDPALSDAKACMNRCRELGMEVAGWAWCANPAIATDEADYHASVCLELGLDAFIANMEAPYDAHGDQTNPVMWAPDAYADGFRDTAPDVELAVTTTPRWGSSGNGLRAAGAVIMPQAFMGEVPDATIPNAVSHAEAWGWTIDRIRPLVQVYPTNGVRPDPNVYNADANACQVGVVPYTLEQAFDAPSVIATLAPAILRPPTSAPKPPDPEPPDPEPPKPGPPPDLPFARALYPPDAKAKGKTPSTDGPDVVAVKRAISRAGYWRWQNFDAAYSNGFAHGRSGDGTGVAGFQAAHVDLQGKPPSGWYGSATHEALRCFVIPTGPHAGEYAFDSYSIAQYRKALG